jgi:uncharacterized pyridoxamine 5'-phosphate oxidase family protein
MQIIQSTSSPESADLIYNFLKDNHSGVLATADSASNPHAATVYFSVDESFCLTFATKSETQKYKDMEENEQVAFVCTNEPEQTTVQINGRVEKVTDPDEHQAVINRMYSLSETLSETRLPPIEKLFIGNYVSLKIVPQVIKMGIFKRPDSQSNEDIYETLLFGQAMEKDNT